MSIIQTRVQDWRMSAPEFDKNMARPSQYGALDFFLSQNAVAPIPQDVIEQAKRSMGIDIKIPVIDYDGNVTITDTRSCTIATKESTTALYSVSWSTLQGGFTMLPDQYSNNEISYQRDFNRKMGNLVRAFLQALDLKAVNKLETEKSQVFADKLNYLETLHVINATAMQADEILGDVDVIMRANDYLGNIHVIGNAGILSRVRKLMQHGANNDVNKALEYAGKTFHFTNNVANEEGKNGTFFAVADGNVAILSRFDRPSVNGRRANGHEWDVVTLPGLGMEVGSHYYQSTGDQSATTGAATADLTCAPMEHFGFSLDVAFITAYNSDKTTIAQPIFKADIAAVTPGSAIPTPVYLVNADDINATA